MAYNHRKAEIEWLNWKEKEEKQMRELGVDEDTIQRLHTYDWQQFNMPCYGMPNHDSRGNYAIDL